MNATTARALHAALIAGVVATLGALTLARQLTGFEGLPLPLAALRLAAFATAVTVLAATRVLRVRLPNPDGEQDLPAWWEEHGRRVLVLWALAEGTVTIGGVLWFLSGDAVALTVTSGVGLLLLLTDRPASLETP